MDSKTSLFKNEGQIDSEASTLEISKRQSIKAKLFRSRSPALAPQPKIFTAEEERAERFRIGKERHFAEQKAKEKGRRKKEKIWDHANSSGGVYTQMYKHDNGKVNKWTLFTAMFAT
ncbi:hypothetical protein HYALB_00002167 [Hymenoscyphus albidus]|uniref:Uncharacterized protein n=1 Tax=Hymenoscyphus albidus TaxID=595503 RepID=A0A9N9Q7F5_9HELO|nr:hypothetical protein HYALB_00002167 [Hymenoscyphus albidus]